MAKTVRHDQNQKRKSSHPDGWHAARKNKGHPRRQERRERAYERGAPQPRG